jgi:predicted amidohydrolase
MAYVVSANTAGIANIAIPIASADGGSKIIDHRGINLAETGAGESMAAFAEIDLVNYTPKVITNHTFTQLILCWKEK